MSLPTIAFDTSVINWMAKDASRSESFIAALRSGFSVQLTGMVVGELISTQNPTKRELLIACCQKLLSSGRSIWPPHEIIRLLILAHHGNPIGFDWRRVDISAPEYARAIVERDFDDALCLEEWKMQKHLEDQFLNHWRDLGTTLQPLFVEKPSLRPKTYAKAVVVATQKTSILFAIAQGLYAKVATVKLNDAEIKGFMDVCPPFRASCYAVLGSWFDCSLKYPPPKNPAGRNDHMMAAYLPYCERFVTRDKKQATRLKEIAKETQINCDVRYYDEYVASFDVAKAPQNKKPQPRR
jgi:hypothetical protein